MAKYILLLLLASSAVADYATYHTALEAAINEQLKPHYVECDIVRKGYYSAANGMVSQPSVSVVCKAVDKTPLVIVSWSAPTTREDGSALSIDEIAGYKLRVKFEKGERVFDLAVVEHYRLEAPVGSRFDIATEDKRGLVSRWSNEVVL